MKPFLTYTFFLSWILIDNSFAQSGCTAQAEEEYKKVYSLVDKARSFSKDGDYEQEKKHAQESVNLSQKIQEKYKCFSPSAYWELSNACSNLGDFAAALKHATNADQFCETFKMIGCRCKSQSSFKIGTIYVAMGNDSMAMIEFKKAFDLCEKDGNKYMEAYILQSKGDLDKKNNNVDLALNEYSTAEEIVRSIGEENEFSEFILGRCYCSTASIFLQRGDCEVALAKFLAALQLSEAVYDRKTISTCFYNVARIYNIKARYADALKYYSDAVKISDQMGYKKIIVDSYFYMANILDSQGDYEKALKYASEALERATKIEYKKGIVDAYNVLGLIKEHQNFDKDLMSNSKSALGIAKDISYTEGIADAYNNIETYYEKKKEYKLARQYATLALHVADSVGHTMVVADAYNDLGDIYLKYESKKDSALVNYSLALKKATEGSYKTCGKYIEAMVDAYNKIAHIYKLKGKRDMAYENYYHAIEIAKEISYQDGICNAENGIRAVKGYMPLECQSKKKLN